LLDLIERAELDVTTVSLAMVTDQYLVYIHGLEQAHPDEIPRSLSSPPSLLQIKSEALLPAFHQYTNRVKKISPRSGRQLKL